MPVAINNKLSLSDDDFREEFSQSGGPGGQNVNKVATAVRLRFHIDSCEKLDPRTKRRLKSLGGNAVTSDGELLIRADSERGREFNRREARRRLAALVAKAMLKPKPRVATKPTRASRERRLTAKKRRGDIKKARRELD